MFRFLTVRMKSLRRQERRFYTERDGKFFPDFPFPGKRRSGDALTWKNCPEMKLGPGRIKIFAGE